ncbi:DUF4129 domain-containing protein [Blastopirellula marina]|uniref:Protein-glutamine gamma-glutamyltransferase-like C-terminal domain-containing protein n=1 Tax=Blastopirellula marina TaxID=124 RepID=A0A2S8FWZ7_9BACT|nr:DUF4129 domain-containing protein [Blastopirellula marina]PQO36706.1 hypothetical protein C5Y98_11995 [Blastopirellula marina]PTL44536.1 DUF4129 domain-containing protein [Blastopirellula marina]
MRRNLLCYPFASLVLLLLIGLPLAAQEEFANRERSIAKPVEHGREAFTNIPQANWYNGESDDLQTIPVPGETKMPESRPGAPPKPKTPTTKTTTTTTGGGGNWLPSIGGIPFGTLLIYTVVLAILAVIGYLIFRAVQAGGSAGVAGKGKSSLTQEEKTRQVDKVEHLPFEVKKKDANLLDEARRCYEGGNFNEAIVYLFSFQLLELDKGHIIRLAKGKTNGQYLREIGRDRNLRQILQGTMNAFEDVFFGNRQLTRDRFERCWSQLSAFDQHLAGGKT